MVGARTVGKDQGIKPTTICMHTADRFLHSGEEVSMRTRLELTATAIGGCLRGHTAMLVGSLTRPICLWAENMREPALWVLSTK